MINVNNYCYYYCFSEIHNNYAHAHAALCVNLLLPVLSGLTNEFLAGMCVYVYHQCVCICTISVCALCVYHRCQKQLEGEGARVKYQCARNFFGSPTN